MKPLVSLIVCTLGRTTELGQLMDSLDIQTYRNFEIILIDQNDDERLQPLVSRFERCLSIRHLRSDVGLSHGRNIGLAGARGELVAFPDDDCEYPVSLLTQVVSKFEQTPDLGGLCGRSIDKDGDDSTAKFDRHAGRITPINLWRRHISVSIFLRKAVTLDVGQFDEQLGVGAGTPWGSGEETDYLLRTLEDGHYLRYDPTLLVTHPRPPVDTSPAALKRADSYGRGMGLVLRRHRYPPWFVAYMIMRPIVGAAVDLLRRRFASAKLRWRVARARATGYWKSRRVSSAAARLDGDAEPEPR